MIVVYFNQEERTEISSSNFVWLVNLRFVSRRRQEIHGLLGAFLFAYTGKVKTIICPLIAFCKESCTYIAVFNFQAEYNSLALGCQQFLCEFKTAILVLSSGILPQ